MKMELMPLAWVSAFTALLWMPYVLNRMFVGGIDATVGYPTVPAPLSPWAQRLKAAHANAIENLTVFAALVLTAAVSGVNAPAIEAAGWLYLWSRVLHAVIYAMGISWLRTIAFTGGFVAQMIVAWQLLTAVAPAAVALHVSPVMQSAVAQSALHSQPTLPRLWH